MVGYLLIKLIQRFIFIRDNSGIKINHITFLYHLIIPKMYPAGLTRYADMYSHSG